MSEQTTRPSKNSLTSAICYLPSKRLCYLSNAKAACTSIKNALWLAESPETHGPSPHSSEAPFRFDIDTLFLTREALCRSTFFTVVRNPYTRALSAYLDKIRPPRDRRVWGWFSSRYQLPEDAEPSFQDYLDIIAGDSSLELNRHFAPQYENTLARYVRPAFVGHLEQWHRVADFLSSFDVALHRAPGRLTGGRDHSTGSRGLVSQFFTPEAVSSVERIYEKDFETFGYAFGLDNLEPIAGSTLGQDTSGLLKLLRDGARQERSEIRLQRDELQSQLDKLRQERAQVRARIEALRNSTSWRVTAPLRGASRVLTSLRGRVAGLLPK